MIKQSSRIPRMSGCLSLMAAAVVSACGGGTGVISTDDLLNGSTSGQSDLTSALGSGGAPTVQIAASKRNSDGAGYMTIAMEGQAFTLASAGTVRYGTGSKWTTKVVSGTGECTDAFFGNDKMTGLAMQCQIAASSSDLVVTAPAPAPSAAPAPVAAPAPAPAPAPAINTTVAITTPSTTPTTSQTVVHGGIAVDTSSQPVPQPGVSNVMLTAPGAIPPAPAPGDWEADGAFRLLCNWSKMSYDDPIVYPGQAGAAHHHTFFGNTGDRCEHDVGEHPLEGQCIVPRRNDQSERLLDAVDDRHGERQADRAEGPADLLQDRVLAVLQRQQRDAADPEGIEDDRGRRRPQHGRRRRELRLHDAGGRLRPRWNHGSAIPKSCQPGDELWARSRFRSAGTA
jgi:hypothetical protein